MTKAMSIKDLVKSYSGFQLGPLSLDLEPGTVLGYIGPNASGKTTTFHCLTGLERADSGRMEFFGKANDTEKIDWKLDVGYVGDRHAFFEGWSGEKNLEFRSRFYPGWSTELARDLARRFNLPLDKKAKDLSTGNRVKLSLVSALAHSPRLLLLDEPTTGLDPVVRKEVLDALFEVLESGERSILYATHILPDISRIADELAFLIDGKLMMRCPKDDLLDKWRRISFRSASQVPTLKAAVEHLTEKNEHQVISADADTTLSHLRTLSVENVQETRMTIDEIAVEILKGGGHVAHH
jgi:ABC-2 type transport system ATP-binding protein